MARRLRGFTLTELLITLTVLTIIGVVAIPSFLSQIRKGRRSDAVSALSVVQQAQEKWRSTHPTYADALDSTGLNLSTTTPGGYYTLELASASASGYIAKANAAGSQAGDTSCATLAIQMDAGTVRYGSGSGAQATTLVDSNGCWPK